ncbi:MAG: SDR family NAD(P)-dependent oxidoreductase [Cyclobacteriaceae bacterium]
MHGTVRPGKPSDSENYHLHNVDLTSEFDCDGLFGQLREKLHQLDTVVLLAGGFAMGNFDDTNIESISNMHQLNFQTAFNISQRALNWMKEVNYGNIMLIGARPAIEGGGSSMLAYTLSKGLVVQLADLLNEAGRPHNVSASLIIPGTIDTETNRTAMPNADFTEWVKPSTIASHMLHLISEDGRKSRNPIIKLY